MTVRAACAVRPTGTARHAVAVLLFFTFSLLFFGLVDPIKLFFCTTNTTLIAETLICARTAICAIRTAVQFFTMFICHLAIILPLGLLLRSFELAGVSTSTFFAWATCADIVLIIPLFALAAVRIIHADASAT